MGMVVGRPGLEPPQGELHKILNLKNLYRAKSSEEPTTIV